MKSEDVWQFVFDCLEKQTPVMLITVVESRGASPGKAGFKMAVAPNGDRCGTIGGGVMEVRWVEESTKRIREKGVGPLVKKLVHSRETQLESSGLICSGSQTILLHPFFVESAETIRTILDTYEQKNMGHLRIGMKGISFAPDQRSQQHCSFTFNSADDWLYEENAGVLDTIYIIGSGHVGLALSRIMATLEFRVVVIDDRENVPTFLNNKFAHQKIHSQYEDIGNHISGTEGEYVAIVTTAYKTDEAALKSIINKDLKYVGLMGSAAKSKQIFDDLAKEGISDVQLKRVHTPIGLPIASHTPEEIAISIAAEIIQAKNEPA